MPLGGIGTGCISLGGRGNFQDWEIMNRPAKGYDACPAFFALWFWSTGDAWGTVTQGSGRVKLEVLFGSLKLSRIQIGPAVARSARTRRLKAGTTFSGLLV